MSANFSRVESGTTTFVPPLGQPDPSADLSKLDRILNGPLDSGIQRQMAGKHLLENADQYADGAVDWEERPKGKEYDFWNKETGVAFVGRRTWRGLHLSNGTYTFLCDVPPGTMTRTFTVG